jgi:hypothetical protein
MAYLTFDKISTNFNLTRAQTLNSTIKNSSVYDTKVFLSYRRTDRKYVEGIVKFLVKVGVTVYIDYLDETLEDKANEVIAATLREHIKSSKKFILLATPDSSNSKWMPWELGLGDRIVNYSNVAILPLTNNSASWGDQEYSKIYGRIEGDYTYSENGPENWNVIFPDNIKKVKLRDWLTA